MNREVHPAAELFPLIEGPEFEELVKSIRDHGLEQEIVLDREGRLLDGRNRLRACEQAKVNPRFTTYKGDDCIDFVIRHNVRRRHMSPSQLAFVAAEMMPMYEAEAKARQVESGLQHGKGAGPKVGVPGPEPISAYRSRDQAGAAVGVSGKSVARAKRVIEQAPELVPEVKEGRMTVKEAERKIIEGNHPSAEGPKVVQLHKGMNRTPRISTDESLERCADGIYSATTVMSSLHWAGASPEKLSALIDTLSTCRSRISRSINQLRAESESA